MCVHVYPACSNGASGCCPASPDKRSLVDSGGSLRTSNCVCAWCGCELPPVDGIAAGEVTHGICAECFEREMAKIQGDNDGTQ